MSLCLACSTVNQSNAKFCSQCGARLLIQDRYRAFKVIGQGGFGRTLLAQDEGKPSKPQCVIKQFTYTGVGMQKASELFQQEAEQLEKLGKHSQIPELLAHTEQDGQQYLVQEFIDGQNIAQELIEQGAFNETKIREFLLDLLPVLDFLHSHQVIHRDIKPENIIRRKSDKKLVLVDFGAAKQATLTAPAKTGTVIGSPEYTAFEQSQGKPVFASDIYSLGVTCLNLLTLCSPFNLKNGDGEWVWRDFLNGAKVSPELGAILDKSIVPLSKRYSSAAEIFQELNLGGKASKPINTSSSVYSYKAKELNSNAVSVPFEVSNKQTTESTSSVSAFEFEYVKTRILTSGFLGLTRKVELDHKRGKAQYIRENLGNGVTIDLVRIPGGRFMMGNSELGDERPIHEVVLQEFWMGKCAVTQNQWQAVMGNNPARFKGENLPVEKVSWNDAMDFCERVSKKICKKMRLPTEAEWEYACRAGTTTLFHFGEAITEDLVNYNKQFSGKTLDVEAFYPNQWGLYQMHGNVWEWCLDDWHDDYNMKPLHLKQNGNNPWGDANTNKNNNRSYVLRGGSWSNTVFGCLSTSRSRIDAFDWCGSAGFRVVI